MSEPQVYRSAWWSVRLPAGWTASEDGNAVELRAADPARGLLQISAARKEGAVDDADVEAFAAARLGAGAPLRPIRLGSFRGARARHEHEGERWGEWWLYQGPLLIYATHVTDLAGGGAADAEVEAILASLQPVADAPSSHSA